MVTTTGTDYSRYSLRYSQSTSTTITYDSGDSGTTVTYYDSTYDYDTTPTLVPVAEEIPFDDHHYWVAFPICIWRGSRVHYHFIEIIRIRSPTN